MKNIQKIILNKNAEIFEKEVNQHLQDGWTYVEKSLDQHISGYKAEGHFPAIVESYAVFLEKKLKKEKTRKK